MRVSAVLVAALLGTVQVSAQETVGGFDGVWRGTVGDQPIHACFNDDTGVYYYNRHLRPIFLQPDGPRFAERISFGNVTNARWHVAYSGPDQIKGEWSDGDRRLPITLEPVEWKKTGEFYSSCATQAFMGPRLVGGGIDAQPATLGDVSYTKLTYVPPAHFDADTLSIQTFALDETQYRDPAINYLLAYDLPRGNINDAYAGCFATSVAYRGVDGDFYKSVEPELITSRWLGVIENNSGYCGGAHPSHWQARRVFDRNSGKEVDPVSWLSEAAMKREIISADTQDAITFATVNKTFASVLLRHWDTPSANASEEDRAHHETCRAAAGRQSHWDIGLAARGKGMAFIPSFPHVIAVCAETVVVPWDALELFLTMEGRAAMLSLQAKD